jgi:NADPH:quinone reductase
MVHLEAEMRAVVLQATGGPEMLVPTEVPEPKAGPGQVLVRTEAIAVSRGETMMRSGEIPLPFPLPAVIGAEAAGIVENVGEGADPGLAGARVTMVTGGAGSYAEFIAIDAGMTVRVPDGLGAVEAVAVAAPGAMALGLLDRAAARSGESLLIEGGSGAAGGYLVGLARELGARRIIATAGTSAGQGRVRELGADVVLDHADPDWPGGLPAALDGGTLDVAFDAAGGAAAGRVLDLLTPSSGRMVCYGMLSGSPPALDLATVLRGGLHIVGCGGPGWFRQVLGVHYPETLKRAARGEIRPRIGAVLPLAGAAEAHRRIVGRTATGRMVLVP